MIAWTSSARSLSAATPLLSLPSSDVAWRRASQRKALVCKNRRSRSTVPTIEPKDNSSGRSIQLSVSLFSRSDWRYSSTVRRKRMYKVSS
eukprot:5030620-Pleurochrysis_carterae.AAC.4